ncbi:MAG: hypothetical protein IT259_15785 [Saprospiraceae bacterium]|nr:hypothetical protein [Saprospiraceae bacterium]
MRRFFLFLRFSGVLTVMLFNCPFLNAQVTKAPEQPYTLLYGIDNTLKLTADDTPDSCLLVRMEGGEVRKYGNGLYALTVLTDSPRVHLDLYDTCRNTLIDRRFCQVKSLPIAIELGRYRGGPISAAAFKAHGGLSARVTGLDIQATLDIVGYRVIFFSRKKDQTWEGYNSGGRFEGQVLEQLQTVAAGDVVIFRQVSYRSPAPRGEQLRFSEQELIFEIR